VSEVGGSEGYADRLQYPRHLGRWVFP